ncbi:hypothetical protein GpartN1_g1130.t1 [Galdieria partita]|uniref:Uncharacterized protein n=1 Tax=Galdieria partita TaxID=83374 RepID=A0A9C7UN11_9RHOD|nr:hypothetical protein GpartN1_g1130.t1 [Galdieria partita]
MVVWSSSSAVNDITSNSQYEEENSENAESYYGLNEIAAANPKYGAQCSDQRRLKDLERNFRDVRFHLPRKNRGIASSDSSSQSEGLNNELPPNFIVKSIRGARHFVTEIEYEIDNKKYTWNSRAHRKQLYMRHVGYFKDYKFQWKYWLRKLKKISVWVGILFTIGSAIFVTSTALEYSMAIYQSYVLFQIFIGWPFFGGAMFYLVGAYANFLEVINAPDVHPIEGDIESLRRAAERYRRRHKYKWFGWYPYRIDYLASLIQLIGAALYSINCFVGNGNTAFTLNFWETEFLYWLPDTLGSICFVVSEYMFYVEYSHGWWCWNPKDVSFWAVFLNVWGAVGFLLDGGFGFGSYAFPADSVYAYIATDLSLLIGCICFLIGSFLLIVEQSGPDATLLPGLVMD